MPEYLAPGVYVEETSFRAKSIEGVGTSTTAFVGPTRKGPVSLGEDAPETPELLTSFGDFERIYGGIADLEFDEGTKPNYLAHAVLAFFNEGGSRLYVARVIGEGAVAASVKPKAGADTGVVSFEARFRGKAGNGTVTLVEIETPFEQEQALDNAVDGTLLRIDKDGLKHYLRHDSKWVPADNLSGAAAKAAELMKPGQNPRVLTMLVSASDADGITVSWEGLAFDRAHPRWIGHVLAEEPTRRSDSLQNPVWIRIGAKVAADELRRVLFKPSVEVEGKFVWRLEGGADGALPTAGDEGDYEHPLAEIAGLDDVSIIAAPGSSAYGDDIAQAVANKLIRDASRPRAYRIAVLDTPPDQTPTSVKSIRGKMDSKYAALYYPWVTVPNPNARPGREDIPRELALPPSGYVAGIYARNDVERGVYKAPANEVVRSALRFERDVRFAEQQMLNPIGVNCLRLMPGRGYRVWGARLVSSDPEWKYVSDRRYFSYLEASIDRGTQWAVFEPNGERLWANIRQTISDFLYNEWRGGALLGSSHEEAYFVRCDRSTMTQNDLDNGRLICLVGVAIIKPAEFVIFRIGQKTADARA